MPRHLFRSPTYNHRPSSLSSLGADIEDMVGFSDDVEIVLDDHYGVSIVDQAMENLNQPGYVTWMKPNGGLLNQIEVALGLPVFANAFVGGAADAPAQFSHQLKALGLAPRQGRTRLAKPKIACASIRQEAERPSDLDVSGEKVGGLRDRQVHDVANALAVVIDLQRRRIIAEASALRAHHMARWQKGHLVLDHAIAATGLTSPALRIERKTARAVTAHLGCRKVGKEGPDLVKDFKIGGRSAATRLANRRLIYLIHRLNLIHPLHPIPGNRCRRLARPRSNAQGFAHRRMNHPSHQAAFARTRNATQHR